MRAAAAWLAAGSLLLVGLLTLAPFSFRMPRRRVRIYWYPQAGDHLVDAVGNVLLFVPLGVAVALLLRDWPVRRRLPACAVAGLAGSLVVEVLQVFLPARNPTVTDLIYNAGGALLGGAAVAAAGRHRIERWAAGATRVVKLPAPALVASLMVLLALQFVLPVYFRRPGRLTAWEDGFPLLIGHESSGDKPWLGIIWELHLLDRALSPEELSRLPRGSDPLASPYARAVVASYQTTGPAPYPDRSGNLPPLADRPVPMPDRQGPARLFDDRWLATEGDVSAASARLRWMSQFTLIATLAPRVTPQAGHRRIVSIAGPDQRRNLGLTQSGEDLFVRVRSKLTGDTGRRPEVRVPGVFAATQPQQIVVTHGGGELAVYVDGIERGRLSVTPEAAVLWRFFPARHWSFEIGDPLYPTSLLYRLILLLPANFLLVYVLRRAIRPRGARLAMTVGALLTVAAANELLLTSMAGGRPRLVEHGTTVLLCVLALLPAVREFRRRGA